MSEGPASESEQFAPMAATRDRRMAQAVHGRLR